MAFEWTVIHVALETSSLKLFFLKFLSIFYCFGFHGHSRYSDLIRVTKQTPLLSLLLRFLCAYACKERETDKTDEETGSHRQVHL